MILSINSLKLVVRELCPQFHLPPLVAAAYLPKVLWVGQETVHRELGKNKLVGGRTHSVLHETFELEAGDLRLVKGAANHCERRQVLHLFR